MSKNGAMALTLGVCALSAALIVIFAQNGLMAICGLVVDGAVALFAALAFADQT